MAARRPDERAFGLAWIYHRRGVRPRCPALPAGWFLSLDEWEEIAARARSAGGMAG